MWLLIVFLAVYHWLAAVVSHDPPPEQRQTGRSVRPGKFLLEALARIAPGTRPYVQKALIRSGYHVVSAWNRDQSSTFMNYGYAPLDPASSRLELDADDEVNRYSIQLYSRVAGAVDLRDQAVLEVGSGRGGGSAFIQRYLHPKTVIGLDFAGEAIKFCRRRYRIDGLSFQQGDAENLPFPAASFDVVVNVESSHCYPSVDRFCDEVQRVLRPGGYFLFADLRPRGDVDLVRQQLQRGGLTLLQQEEITANVARALELDSERRRLMVQTNIPRVLRRAIQEFLGVKGSPIYEALCSGDMVYLRVVLRKTPSPSNPSGESDP